MIDIVSSIMAVYKMISIFIVDWMLRMLKCNLMVVSESVMGRQMIVFVVKDFMMISMTTNWVHLNKVIMFTVIFVIEIRMWSSIC